MAARLPVNQDFLRELDAAGLRIDPEIVQLMVDLTEETFNQEIGADFSDFVGKVAVVTGAASGIGLALASWLVEKRRTWSHSNGNVESRFSKDELCTIATLYWVTQSYGTSARYYYECTHNPWKPSHSRVPVVEAPTAPAPIYR